MNIVKILFFIMIMLISGVIASIPSGASASDTEMWNIYNISVPLTGRTSFLLRPEFRFNRDASTIYYWRIFLGPNVSVNPWLDLAAYYIPKWKKNGGVWPIEDLGFVDGTLKCRLSGLRLSTRNRLEYSFDAEELKYRNRVKAARHGMFGNRDLALFLSEEIFYHFDSHSLGENRASVGASLPMSAQTGVELSLMHRSVKKDEWLKTVVIVLNFSLSI